MRVLITGNLGYIGTVLSNELEEEFEIVGYDIGYFKDCILKKQKTTFKQIIKDIHKVNKSDIDGIDAIIHLAALSNDPLGEFDKNNTYQTNYLATVALAKLAKETKVKRFIYLSSQSMYGISDTTRELDEDNSEKNLITEYAKTKWQAEKELNKLNSKNFTVVMLRPSTVFGVSPRLRCDIVFNNLVACAYTTKKIEIKSDGSPWRPVIHVKDVCSAIIACLKAPTDIISGQAFNVGLKNGNYTVKELALVAQKAVPGSSLAFTNEHKDDPRTYKVSFEKIYKILGEYFKPKWTLEMGANELIEFFSSVNFREEDFRGYKTNRLVALKKYLA